MNTIGSVMDDGTAWWQRFEWSDLRVLCFCMLGCTLGSTRGRAHMTSAEPLGLLLRATFQKLMLVERLPRNSMSTDNERHHKPSIIKRDDTRYVSEEAGSMLVVALTN